MTGKVRRLVMVLVAMAMMLSLAAGMATVAGTKVSADPGVDEWSGFTLPSEVGYQLFPGTEVGPIALADDGTLFAVVYDETFNRWGSPRGTVFAVVFYSTDGGYNWDFGWELPEDDPGLVVDIVAAPGYVHPGTIYIATQTYLYYSEDGGNNFYRTFSVCPGVADDPGSWIYGGVITSLDVAIDAVATDEYVAVVGTNWGGLDGVYTWNLGGTPVWQDMEIGNRIAATWDTSPYYNQGVLEVAFSPNYPQDKIIYTVANYDPCIISPPWTGPSDFTTVITVYDGTAGTWGIQYMDAAIWTIYIPDTSATGAPSTWARLAFFDDFDIAGSPYCVVAVSGTPTVGALGPVDDVYRIKSLPPAVGPSPATAMDLVGSGVSSPYYSIDAYGMMMLTGTVVVGVEFPPGSGQAQVFVGTSPLVFPQWEPAMKPPSGGMGLWAAPFASAWTWTGTGVMWWSYLPVMPFPGGIYVVTDGDKYFVATGENWGLSPSGVSVGRINIGGKFIWNGVGLIDTIGATTDVLGWTNYAAIVYEEVSPHYASGSPGDDTLYITTWKHGWNDAFVHGRIEEEAGSGTYGWFQFAIEATGKVSGLFEGRFVASDCFVPFTGTLNGTATPGPGGWSSAQGDFEICAGDPIGSCCTGTWSAAFAPTGAACDSINGSMTFTLDCTDLVCSGSTAFTGSICPNAYGLDLWRHAPTGQGGSPVWERIAYENLVLPLDVNPPFNMIAGLPATVSAELLDADVGFWETMVPRVAPGFEFDANMDADEYLFLLAGMSMWAGLNPLLPPDPITNPLIQQGYTDMLFYSWDGGESMYYTSTMPVGALRWGIPGTSGSGMSDTGWTVVDDSTIIMGDIIGYIYKTTNCGNSWTDGVETAPGVPTDLNVSPIYSESGGPGMDKALLVGLYNTAVDAAQAWISFDGAEGQFVQVGHDIVDDRYGLPSKVAVKFDPGWALNERIYAACSGFLSRYCCDCPFPAPLVESGDAGVYRNDVNTSSLGDSLWEQIYGYSDLEPNLPGAATCAWRYWAFTDLEYGHEGTLYIPFGVLEWIDTLNAPPGPEYHMNFVLGGALRTRDGTTTPVVDWDVLTEGLPHVPHSALWLLRAVPGTNHLFSIAYQLDIIQNGDGGTLDDYDFALVTYEDPFGGPEPEWTVPMIAETATEGSNPHLAFGVHPNATDAYDSRIDVPHTPPGPAATFDAYFDIDDQLFPRVDKDYRSPADGIQWALCVGADSEDITLTWDATDVPTDRCAYMDTGMELIDMKAATNTTLPAGQYSIPIVVGMETEITLKAGWNMVSVPVIPPDPSVDSVFPGAELVCGWDRENQMYIYSPAEVEPDQGYWVAVMGNTTVTVCGMPVYEWTGNITAGWNMIGSVIDDVLVTEWNDAPDGCVEPYIWWWNPLTRQYEFFVLPCVIESTKGYWIGAVCDCILTLP